MTKPQLLLPVKPSKTRHLTHTHKCPIIVSMEQGELKQLRPSNGNFRVAGLDLYGLWSWVDVATMEEVWKLTKGLRGVMSKVYVFDRSGDCVHQA